MKDTMYDSASVKIVRRIPLMGDFVAALGTQARTMMEISETTKETQKSQTLFFWNVAKLSFNMLRSTKETVMES